MNSNTDPDGFETLVQEWRWFERHQVEQRAKELLAEGWQKDGGVIVHAGHFTERYVQKWIKPKQ